MTDLTKLCDELEECKKKSCYKDEVKCVRAKLERYVDGDEEKILRLKAQLSMYENDDSITVAGHSALISSIALCLTVLAQIIGGKSLVYQIIAVIYLLVLVVYIGIHQHGRKKYGYRKVWKQYIKVVLDEMGKKSL